MSSYPQITKRNMELTPMQVFWSPHTSRINCTTPVASPGVVTATAHGYANGDRVVFTTLGALPTGIIPFKPYVVASATANTFEVEEVGIPGVSIDFTGTTSGQSRVQKEVDLGGTLDNVVISAKYTKADIKADQFGETVLDRRVKGIELSVTTALAEIRNKDTWQVAFPNITRLDQNGDAVRWDTKIGEKDTDLTGFLRLHPLSEDNDELGYDYFMYEAVASSESQITYSPTEQAKLQVVWMILPDDSVAPARFFQHGDLEATA